MTDFVCVFEEELEAVGTDHRNCSQFVPGVGPLDADIVLVGEAPGAREVEQGTPFVGQAGSQLDRTLASLGVERDGLYITNLVKVRPPGNRTPHKAEIEAWRPLLEAEIDRVDPAVIIPMGTTAARALLDTDEGITTLHGRRFERDGRTVAPVYHPAAVLYDRGKRTDFEADLRTAFNAAA